MGGIVRVAIVPARGGSKRIPRKNIKNFAGKPIIAYSIECAKSTGLFDRIIVSTDDTEIAEVARQFGAEVPSLRPAEFADDHAGTSEVVAHSIRCLHGNHSDVTAVCCIYPTAPFIHADDLTRGLRVMESGDWKFVFSAASFPSPILRAFERQDSGRVKMFFPENYAKRSQDLPETWFDAAQFYWGQPAAWLDNLRIFDEHSTIVPIPSWRVHDINTSEEWIRAELLVPVIARHESSAHSATSSTHQ
jgi:N-acylneuraminate cytidylyltransferase